MDSQTTLSSVPTYSTIEEVFERLQVLTADASVTNRSELDALKQTFYKIYNQKVMNEKAEFVQNGGEESAFVSTFTDEEARFKELMGEVKEARFALHQEMEMQKQQNYVRSLAVIDKIKALLEKPDEVGAHYADFKALTEEWTAAKPVPEDKATDIWKNYQYYREQFYDQLKLNNEFREYDFKKNLELKTALCEKAERLGEADDVISAFHALQSLHQEYREIGPVAKELREDLWNRFKAASTIVNKRHQDHFEQIREQENQNLEKKTSLCEKVEAIMEAVPTTNAGWAEKAQEIIEIQKQWREIGFAPQKMNQKIFDRFRAACDSFFTQKAEVAKQFKQGLAENLEKKTSLCEKVEALKDSTDWAATSDIIIKLQKEWKTIGPVPHKQSDAVWKRFCAACDFFFEQKGKATSSVAEEQKANLEKKKQILEKLRMAKENVADGIDFSVKEVVAEWNSIGHVPFKEKDKLYDEFHEIVDFLFKEIGASNMRRRLDGFKNNLKEGKNSSASDRSRLVRRRDALQSEIQTYENNLGFINASSKKGNSLTAEIERNIEKLKSEYQLVVQKIKAIDANE